MPYSNAAKSKPRSPLASAAVKAPSATARVAIAPPAHDETRSPGAAFRTQMRLALSGYRFDAFKATDSRKGVACLYGNHAGDNMTVKMAMEMAEDDGIEVKRVVANDDVPSAPKGEREKRRGAWPARY